MAMSLKWMLVGVLYLQALCISANAQSGALTECDIDLVILIDRSGSIFDNGLGPGQFGYDAWYNMTNFTQSIINTVVTPTVNSHVALVTFGHFAELWTNGLITDKANLTAAVERLKVPVTGQNTNTSGALFIANQLFDGQGNALAGDRPNVPNVVIMVTDGIPTRGNGGLFASNGAAEAALIRQQVIDLSNTLKNGSARAVIMSIGVTDSTDPELLRTIATNNDTYIAVMDFSALNAQLEPLILTTCQTITPPPDCRQPADIYFVLDSSGSIGEIRFKQVRQFIATMMNRLPIGNGAKAGLLYFSQNNFMGFNLNQYGNPQAAGNATLLTPYMRSTTNTADMLRYLRLTAFTTAEGGRSNFPDIAVLFTDGNSNVNRANTLAEAALAKRAGIHIIVVGISNWFNQYELQGMASDPYSANYIQVGNATLLNTDANYANTMKALLCNDVNNCNSVVCQCGGTCVDKIGGFMCQCPGTCAGVLCETQCSQRMNVVFAMDSSSSLQETDFRMALNFVRTTIVGLNIMSGDRVGVVRFSTSPNVLFYLNNYTSTDSILNALTVYFNGGMTNTMMAIQTATNTMFSTSNGATAGNNNVLVIITDGRSASFDGTWTQAKLSRESGINVVVVGVTSNIYIFELQTMASGLDNTNVFTVADFNSLTSTTALATSVTDAICNNRGECETVQCLNGGTAVDSIGFCSCNCPTTHSGNRCERLGSGKVDIALVIDSSGSIRSDRMLDVLTFITDFIKNYPMGPNGARFAAIYFSDTAVKAFELNAYTLMEDVITHILRIPFLGQRTNIADAIAIAKDNTFLASKGDRSDAPNYIMLFTDGASNINKEQAIPNAIQFRENVGRIIVMGVGSDANTLELRGIASQPMSDMMMMVPSFNSIISNATYRSQMLNSMTMAPSDGINQCDTNPCAAGSTCVDSLHTYICECPTTRSGRNCSRTCTAQLDVALVLDFSSSLDMVYNTVISFAREMVYGLPAPTNVRIAVVEYDAQARVAFQLNNFTSSKEQILNALSFTDRGTTTNTAAALDLLRTVVFASGNGKRSGVKSVAVVVTDGGSQDTPGTIAAANNAMNDNIEIFVAGYGGIQMDELNGIASNPDTSHVRQIGVNNNPQAAAGQMLDLLCQL